MNTQQTPFTLVLFGATGDLARRRLLPSLFALFRDGRLPAQWQLVGVGRSERTSEEWEAGLLEALQEEKPDMENWQDDWADFAEHLAYFQGDASAADDMRGLASQVQQERCLFYLATRADLYGSVTRALASVGLVGARSSIVMEKPIGLDLESARAIDDVVSEYFAENQIYRIDHYLGKETVQNLLVLRFANSIFESQWNHHFIDHIQITIAESGSVAGRAAFYDEVGALRDMVQNHLLQLLCMTAMEPPHALSADAVRDEKVKVLKSLRPLDNNVIPEKIVRGQYQRAGDEPGYLEDIGSEESDTETFAALKVEIDNWRWAGVPFYLRTGKRLAERACEIAVHFRPVPHSIFTQQHRAAMANRLVFRLQPDEGIQLSLSEKQPGAGMNIKMSELSLNPETLAGKRVPDAYERLLSDVLADNQTLFVRRDELMAAWEWIDPIIQHWRQSGVRPEPYQTGSWGPSAATLLLARDGRLWDELAGGAFGQWTQGGKS